MIRKEYHTVRKYNGTMVVRCKLDITNKHDSSLSLLGTSTSIKKWLTETSFMGSNFPF
jgi:hypothetical protein